MNKSMLQSPMPILLNDEPCQVPKDSSLLTLIRNRVAADHRAIAVSLNGVFVRRADWDGMKLAADDRVALFQPTQA